MIDQEQATLIAQWWAERMTDIVKNDNGDPRTEGAIAVIKSEFGLKETPSPTGMQLRVFTLALSEVILRNQPKFLTVDYDPDKYLEFALKAAMLRPSILPIKTSTWHESMSCRIGYSGEIQPIELSPPGAIH